MYETYHEKLKRLERERNEFMNRANGLDEELARLQRADFHGSYIALLQALREDNPNIADKKVNTIKAVRDACGLGLKEAKDLVDVATGYVTTVV